MLATVGAPVIFIAGPFVGMLIAGPPVGPIVGPLIGIGLDMATGVV
jgi:hypothetical protein